MKFVVRLLAEVKPGEVYPFRFFPHCRGPKSGGTPPLPSLHQVTDRFFHEGISLDSHDKDGWGWFGARAGSLKNLRMSLGSLGLDQSSPGLSIRSRSGPVEIQAKSRYVS